MKKLLLILLCLPMIGFGQWKYKRIEDPFSNKNERVAYIKSSKSSTNTHPTLVIKREEAVDSEKMNNRYQKDPSLPFREYDIYLEDCYIGNSYSFQYLIKYGDSEYDRENYIYLSRPNENIIGLDGKNKDACFLSYASRLSKRDLINVKSFLPFFDQLKKGSSLEIQISSSYGIYEYSFSLSGSTKAINYISSITKSEEELKKIYQSKIVQEIDAKKDLIPGVCDYQGNHIFTFPSSDRWDLPTYSGVSPGFMFPGAEKEKGTGYKTGYAKGGISSLAPYLYSRKILEKMGIMHLKDNPQCIIGNINVPYDDSEIWGDGKRRPGSSSYKGFRLKHNCIPKNNTYYNKSFNLKDIQ